MFIGQNATCKKIDAKQNMESFIIIQHAHSMETHFTNIFRHKWFQLMKQKNITRCGINENMDWNMILDNPDEEGENGWKWDWNYISRNPKLITLNNIKMFKYKWDWNAVVGNGKLTYEMILEIPNKSNDMWAIFSMSKLVTLDDIDNNLHQPWDWRCICSNPNLTFDFVLKHYKNKKDKFNWYAISLHKNITMGMIEHNDLPWDFRGISYNPNLTAKFLLKHRNKNWNWQAVSRNENIPIDFIMKHLNLPWDWNEICSVQHIPIDIILKFSKVTWWDWSQLTEMCDIQDIMQNPNLPWKWDYLVLNRQLTIDFVLQHTEISLNPYGISCLATEFAIISLPNFPWNWCIISRNENITMKFIANNLDLPWVWDFVSCNPNLTIEMIRKFPNKSWNWRSIRRNPNLTFEMISEIYRKTDGFGSDVSCYICENPLTNERNQFVEQNIFHMVVMSIFDFYQQQTIRETMTYTVKYVEQVFLDEYLVKNVVKY